MDDDSQQEEFLLKWNDHHNSFFSIVQDLCASELLTDVTLACGSGEPIIFEAHKLMLSVCSTFFRNIFTRKRADRYQAHPIVFLKDVEPRHMEQLLQYMYRGEINVLQDDLGPLIETARALQVKGLADAPPGTGSGGGQNKKPMPVLQPGHLPPLKKAKTNHSSKKESHAGGNRHHPSLPTSHLAQRLTQPKRPSFMPPLPTEPEPPENIRFKAEDQIDLYGAPVVGDQDNSADGTDYGAFTETELHTEDDSNFGDQVVGGNSFLSSNNSGGGGGSILEGGMSNRLRYKCEECGKAFITPSKLQRHSYSHSGIRPFQCNICAKSFSQSANLKTHMKNTHPSEAGGYTQEASEQSLTSPPPMTMQMQTGSSTTKKSMTTFAAAAAVAAMAMANASAELSEDSEAITSDRRDPHEPDY